MKFPTLPQGLVLVAAFLAPIIGGHVATDMMSLPPGSASWLLALGGDAEVPLLTHGILATLVTAAFVAALIRRQVIQVPPPKMLGALGGLCMLLTLSLSLSRFRMASIGALGEWLSFAVALVAGVAVLGRRQGPMAAVAAAFAGCTVVAIRGILEFGAASDPTWRIFAGWNNPNAAAAVLLIGFFLGLALTLVLERTTSLVCGLGTVLVAFALVLTQSKGGFAALAVGLVGFVACLFVTRAEVRRSVMRAAVVLVAVFALAGSLQLRQSAQSGGQTALGRVAAAGATQEQSAGFRANLWRGAVAIVRENPVGTGIGTYRHESARSGLTTQTQLAHQSYLQLAVEASPLAVGLLIAIGGIWVVHTLRSSRSQPTESNLLRAGVVAAVVAIGAHSFVDSDLSYYGVGFLTFLLMGVGLLLAADGVAPEYGPKELRVSAIFLAVLPPLLLVYAGSAESTRAQVRGALETRNAEAASAGVASLLSLTPFDGEAWYLSASLATTQNERLLALEQAARLSPSTRNLRALARQQASTGRTASAVSTLNDALRRDPNNLLTLNQLLETHIAAGNTAEATAVAQRLVDVEAKPYYQVRSQPELVPTETLRARAYLAQSTGDPRRRVELLRPAVEGFLSYGRVTAPLVKRNAPMDFAGETLDRAVQRLEEGRRAAAELAASARRLPDEGAIRFAEEAGDELAAAVAGLSLDK